MIPFKLATTIIPQKEVKLKARFFPKENDTIKTKTGNLSLSKKISEGGEGIIYAIKENKSIVCKIYHPEKLTNLKKEKIELMISKKISFEGICWPIDIVLNSHDEFVGYVMPAASGKTMQTSMFIKPQLLKNFPHFTRKDLASIAISFLHKMDFLHSMNIIVGDINALNILVEPNGKIWFVDTDSYQIENFPCPVGTVNFTAPEIQGRDYADFLRTKNHELFAIATMVFMILFPGKPPYSQQGGESQSDNIKKMNFPYWCSEKAEVNPPEGSWNFIWANLIKKLKELFCMTFKNNQRQEIRTWISALDNYIWAIKKGYVSDELFPNGFPIYDPVEVSCSKCGELHLNSQKRVDKMRQSGKGVFCNDCHKEFKLKSLARQSFENKKSIIDSASTIQKKNTRINYNNSKPNKQHLSSNGTGGIIFKKNYNSKSTTQVNKQTRSTSYNQLQKKKNLFNKTTIVFLVMAGLIFLFTKSIKLSAIFVVFACFSLFFN